MSFVLGPLSFVFAMDVRSGAQRTNDKGQRTRPVRFPPSDNLRSPAALTRFAATTLVGLALDLWTKLQAETHLSGGSVVHFVPGWLHFEYTENHGAVFGLGQGWRWLFVAVSVAAIAFLTWLFAASGRRP